MNPFFSYFGSKFRLAKFYPKPIHETIIEPFAGSAGYSLLHYKNNVILYDTYEPIIQLWNYLINVKEEEILSLPVDYKNEPFSKNNPVSNLDICEEAKILIGFWLTESQSYSSTYPLSKSRGGNWSDRKKKLIASQLKNIRHWKADFKDYKNIDENLDNITWYVDPPYFDAGKRYKLNKIDYNHLGSWCKSKTGQIIVCEQNEANWLDFVPLQRHTNASNKKYMELLWINEKKL